MFVRFFVLSLDHSWASANTVPVRGRHSGA